MKAEIKKGGRNEFGYYETFDPNSDSGFNSYKIKDSVLQKRIGRAVMNEEKRFGVQVIGKYPRLVFQIRKFKDKNDGYMPYLYNMKKDVVYAAKGYVNYLNKNQLCDYYTAEKRFILATLECV